MALINSPLDITGCKLWLDANQGLLDQFGNPVTANGTSIGTWQDQSGNNNHVTSSSGTSPTYVTNVRTSYERYSNVVRFGGNGLLAAGDVLGLGTNHGLLFAVIKNTTAPTLNAQHIMSKSRPGSTGQYFLSRTSTGDPTVSNGLLGFAWTNGFMNTTLLNTCSEYTIVCWNFLRNQSVNGPMRLRANKFQVSTDAGGNDNGGNFPLSARFCIGGRNDSTGFADNTDSQYYFNGDICECGVYLRSTPYNAYEIQQLENYLYNKWFSSTLPTIFGCKIWLDASDSTTLFKNQHGTIPAVITDNNNPIGCWKNKATVSGGYGNFTAIVGQSVTQMPSAKVSSYNSLSTVWFNGLTTPSIITYLSLSASDQTTTGGFRHQQQTAFIVTAPHISNYVNGARILAANRASSGANDGVAGFLPFAQSSVTGIGSYIDNNPYTTILTVKGGEFNILTSRADNTAKFPTTRNSQLTAYYENNTFTGKLSSYGFRLGANIGAGGVTGGSGGVQYNGEISEVLLYDRFLTNAECHQIEYYLAKKWKVPEAKFAYAVRSGNWSDDATWSTNIVPTLSSDVYSNGYSVTIDQDITDLSVRNLKGTPPPAYPSLSIADTGSFLLSQPYTINIPPTSVNHFTIVAGTAPCLDLNVSTGSVNIVGNIISGTTSPAYGLIQRGTSPLTVYGKVIANQAIGLYNSAGTSVTITQTLSGGAGSDTYGLYNQVPFCNITVLSGVGAGTGTRSAGISSISTGALTLSGRILAGTGLSAAAVFSPVTTTIAVTGDVTGGSNTNASGILCLSAEDINILGVISGGSGLSACGINIPYTKNMLLSAATPGVVVKGGSGESTYGIYNVAANNITAYGSISGGTSQYARGINSSYANDMLVIRNVLGGTLSATSGVYNLTSNSLFVSGNITGGNNTYSTGVTTLTTGSIKVIGNITGGTMLSCSGLLNSLTNTIEVSGNLTGGSGADSRGLHSTLATTSVLISGNATGGSAFESHGILWPHTPTAAITGNVTGGSNSAHGILCLSGIPSIFVKGNIQSGSNSAFVTRSVTPAAPTSITVIGNLQGTGGGSGILSESTGDITVFGNVIGGAGNGIQSLSSNVVYVSGSISGGSAGTGLYDRRAQFITIVGSISGGTGGSGYGLRLSSPISSTVNISATDISGRVGVAIYDDLDLLANYAATGVGSPGPEVVSNIYINCPLIRSGSNSGAISSVNTGQGADIYITGNVSGSGANPTIVNVNRWGKISIKGDVIGGLAPNPLGYVIENLSNATLEITGSVIASPKQGAIRGPSLNAICEITGPIINDTSTGRQALWLRTYFHRPKNFDSFITHGTTTGAALNFYAPEGYPASQIPPVSSVSTETVYAVMSQLSGKPFINVSQLTGTMIVPSVSSVRIGVPVGIETGKVKSTTLDLVNMLNITTENGLLTSYGTYGNLLTNICSKQTALTGVSLLIRGQ